MSTLRPLNLLLSLALKVAALLYPQEKEVVQEKEKKSLDSVFGAVSKQKLCAVLCEIVHFFLLLFNKDSDRF